MNTTRLSRKLAVLLAVLAFGAVTLAAAEPRRPNIVLILADDSGLGEWGCYGGTAIPTPAVDRLAREGVRFTQAYSGSAVCAPSRYVLMTGLHTGHILRRANQSRIGLIPLPADTLTLARLLQREGYATGGFGKWGLGNEGTTGAAEKQGFDLFYGYYDQVHAHSYYPADLTRNGRREPLPGNAGGRRGQYAHDLIEAETLAFIDRSARARQPFFCYAAWTLPHDRFEIPSHAAFDDREWPTEVKIHAAMIARLDASVARVMAALERAGVADNTLVIFTSDNGADGPGRTIFNATAGLRGHKRDLHEGGIRAPLVVRWPGVVAPGRTSATLTSQVDLMATVANLVGSDAPVPADGLSLLPSLRGESQTTAERALYWEIYEPQPAPFQQAVRLGSWKGYRTKLAGPLALYDLAADPAETTDIAGRHPEVVRRLEAIMAAAHVPSPHYETR